MRISRREALTGTALALIGSSRTLASASSIASPLPPGARPNILWLVSEDNNPYIGAYGDKIARTPTLDALARKGITYRNAFSTGPVCATSRFAILTGMHAESCGPAQHMRAVAHLPAEIKTYPEYMREAGYYCTNNAKTDYNCDVDPNRIWDESSTKAQWYNRPQGKPFMAVYNYGTTHESQLFFDTPGNVKPADVRVPRYLPDSPPVRQDIASYYNLMEKMDGELGQRIRQIEERGAADDTIIFYYSDNGGVLPRSKHYSWDEGYRTALIVYIPPKWQHLAPAAPGTVIDAPVTYADLAPTLLSLIGQDKPAYMQGRALMGPKEGALEQYAFGARDRMDEGCDFSRTVTDGRYRLIRNYLRDRPASHDAYSRQMKSYQDYERRYLAGQLDEVQDRFFQRRPYEELYDLQSDRDGVRNLINDPAHKASAETMRRALDAHMLEIVDNGFIPEGAAPEGYEASRNKAAYPLERIMALAALAAKADRKNVPALRAALRDDNAVVRYWGAAGLRFLGKKAAPARADLERVAGNDPVPQVRIPAASALANLGAASGVARLGEILGAPNQIWQLKTQSLDALIFAGKAANAVLPQIEAAAKDNNYHVGPAARYLLAKLNGTYTPESPIFTGSKSAAQFSPMKSPPL